MTALPSRAADGRNRAEIDDIGPIFKACAAFNAWYRHASGSCRNRAGLRFVKRLPDATRSRNKPILRTVQRDRRPFPRPQIEPRLTEATDAMSFLAFGSISSRYPPDLVPVCLSGKVFRANQPGISNYMIYRDFFYWSEREDSNLRPPAPEAGALPDCATLRPLGGGYPVSGGIARAITCPSPLRRGGCAGRRGGRRSPSCWTPAATGRSRGAVACAARGCWMSTSAAPRAARCRCPRR